MAKNSYPRSSRLTSRGQFTAMQSKGRRARADHLLVSYALREAFNGPEATASADVVDKPVSAASQLISRTTRASGPRLGITVTKKIDKRAARRNYFKRAVREWFRRAKNYIKEPMDIVVVAFIGAAELKAPQIWDELDIAFKQARLIPRNFNFAPEGVERRAKSAPTVAE